MNKTVHYINKIHMFVLISLMSLSGSSYAVEFNADALDANDKENIDLSRFSQANYVMPGTYQLIININQHDLPEHNIQFLPRENAPESSEPCLPPELVGKFGLKEDMLKQVRYWHADQCADLSAISGVTTKTDLGSGRLYLSIPQAWLEYSDASWSPPSRWDEGIPGFLLDYNLNSQINSRQQGNTTRNSSISGTSGVNYGPWRLRGDYQGNYSHSSGNQADQSQFDWSRVYLYRALPKLAATLSLGENFFYSDIFDTFRYTGMSLVSDERMLPPNLRGYAPEVSGIARTNAKVTISQQGRVIYQTTVAAGPFRIQDLNSMTKGRLDVTVEEQDGSQQSFQVDTATIPYLTRAGAVRYKTAMGRPSTLRHGTEGPMFASGEFSWGVSNSWSLYGGGIGADDYQTLSLGIGRDLYILGAMSADMTQSYARNLPGQDTQAGKSFRLSYAKRFDESNSEVTFAGYRFSEREFMSMNDYLNARYRSYQQGRNKEMYTVSASKSFPDAQLSFYLSYSHQTYWDQKTTDRYSLSASQTFDLFSRKNTSLSLSATRSQDYQRKNDDALYLRLSVPLGNRDSISYSGQYNNYGGNSQRVTYANNNTPNTSYNLSTGVNSGNDNGTKSQLSGFYSHNAPFVDISVNGSYVQDNFTSAGLSLRGGMTATAKGAALHRGGTNGGTRLMLDTDGIAGVPINNGRIHSNTYGIAIQNEISSYYRTDSRIDINQLDDDVEARQSVVEAVLTEGAIGYRRFSMIKGQKIIATLKLADNRTPPFGSSVINAQGQELAIISDGGFVYLSGVQPGETLDVLWGGAKQCQISIPETLSPQHNQLLLPCQRI